MTLDTTSTDGRGWPRAAGLFALVLAMSVVHPSILVALPLLLLLGVRGARGGALFFVMVVAMFITLAGVRDGLWFAERAWSLLLGGAFVALTTLAPAWRVSSRALASVAASAAVFGTLLAVRAGAWAAIDWSVTDRLRAGFATWLDAMVVLREGEALSPSLVSAIYQTAEWQAAVFPALVGLESMAALAVAWWIYLRLVEGNDGGVGPLRGFRFNDHLVWLLIAGLVLLVVRSGDALTRVGANLAVFMGALYALRGAGVVIFVSGGVSLLGYLVLVLGFVFAAPVVIGFAVLVGIGDTWLDLRARVGARAA